MATAATARRGRRIGQKARRCQRLHRNGIQDGVRDGIRDGAVDSARGSARYDAQGGNRDGARDSAQDSTQTAYKAMTAFETSPETTLNKAPDTAPAPSTEGTSPAADKAQDKTPQRAELRRCTEPRRHMELPRCAIFTHAKLCSSTMYIRTIIRQTYPQKAWQGRSTKSSHKSWVSCDSYRRHRLVGTFISWHFVCLLACLFASLFCAATAIREWRPHIFFLTEVSPMYPVA